MPLPRWAGRHTRRRRLVQLACLAVFALVPLTAAVRVDFAAGRLLAVGRTIRLDEWALLWLVLMLAMWVVGALSLVLGRVYCAYACPQTVFGELAHDLDALGARLAGRRAARLAAWSALTVLCVTASILFLGWFVPLAEVPARLPWLVLACSLLGLLSFGLVRERFCRSVCPYGLLQAVIEDGHSLHVGLDPRSCTGCGACARACPMGIDIRTGAFQIECTRCGSCVDACDAVLARLRQHSQVREGGRTGTPGLIAGCPPPAGAGALRFDFGHASLRRWDARRVLVAVATTGFAVALGLALLTRDAVGLHLSPVYDTGVLGESRFLLRAANRLDVPITLTAQAEGLPEGAVVEGLGDGRVPASGERVFTLVVRLRGSERRLLPFAWVVVAPDGEHRFPSTFYAARRSDRRNPS